MGYTIRSMAIDDYDSAVALWQNTEDVVLIDTDG
jgi:hypothetical protein